MLFSFQGAENLIRMLGEGYIQKYPSGRKILENILKKIKSNRYGIIKLT